MTNYMPTNETPCMNMEQTGHCRREWGRGDWMNGSGRMSPNHMFITRRHSLQCDDGQRQRGWGAGGGGQRGEIGLEKDFT